MSHIPQKSIMALAAFLPLVLTAGLQAVELQEPQTTLDQRSSALQLSTLQPLVEPQPVWANLQDDPFGDPREDPEMYGFKPRSPRRAFFYSLLVPGAGQVYNRSMILKPILFLGLEAAGIFAYANSHKNGIDRRHEYEDHANKYWFYDGYIESLEAQHPSGEWRYGDTAVYWVDTLTDWKNLFSEHLEVVIDQGVDSARAVRNLAYYENIGKYDQFKYGWDDHEPYPDTARTTPRRETYLGMRKKANDEFSKASTFLVLTIVNHLVSAFDAALSARRYNNQQDRLANVGVKMRYVLYDGRPMPKVMLTYRY